MLTLQSNFWSVSWRSWHLLLAVVCFRECNRSNGGISVNTDNKKKTKHVKTIIVSDLKSTVSSGGCRECQTSCQSACKTSCTLGNQACRK
ncbi:MAG TPA: six-cysteine peptide SCIFF [Firmicutes bacterium]|nr:six-cysteine peptide SCIFF [Bacillota bacterium]HAN86079.1 six-cysteine peptide SCIFF [Bacillota bacterium]